MAPISEDELAGISGPDLVAHLSSTHRRADFEAVARILVARDRRNAEVQAELAAALADLDAALADLDAAAACGREATEVKDKLEAARMEVDAVREKYRALLGPFLPPPYEFDKMPPMVGAAVPDSVRRDDSRVEEAEEREVKDAVPFINLCSDEEEEERAAGGSEEEEGREAGGSEEEDEEDTEPLSQRVKRLRGAELESGKVDVRGQSDSVGTLGNHQPKSSSVKIDVPVATTGKMASKPEDSKVADFVQESSAVKTEKFGGELPRTAFLPSQGLLGRITMQEGSSKGDYCKAGTGDKGRSSDGVPARGDSQASKGIDEMNKTPMVESSGKELRKTRDAVPFEPCNESNTYAQVKTEMGSLPSAITSKWESEGHIVTSLLNIEVCMQALCALYRQGKLANVDKRVELRAKKLAEFLLDGDLQGSMKRTAEELQKQNVTNVPFIQNVTVCCSEQLFGIFRSKKDPYFR